MPRYDFTPRADPTPEQIAARCAIVQAQWDEQTRLRRRRRCRDGQAVTWTPPICSWPAEQLGDEHEFAG